MKAEKQITDFTTYGSTNYAQLGADIVAALAGVSATYGIKFSYRGAKHSENVSELKIEAAIIDGSGTVATREAEIFLATCELFELKKTDLNRSFNYQGQDYVLIGARNSAKTPMIGKRVSDGKELCFPATLVYNALNMQRASDLKRKIKTAIKQATE